MIRICQTDGRFHVQSIIYHLYRLRYYLSGSIPVHLSGTGKVLQLCKKYFPECFFDVHHASALHHPYALVTIAPAAIFFIPTSGYSPWSFCFLYLLGFALLAFINGHFLVKIFDNYIIPEKDEISEEGSEETPDDTSRNTPAV